MYQALAQSPNPIVTTCLPNSLCTVITTVVGYLNQALFLLMAFAIVMFVWYIIQFFIKPDSDKKEAGNYVMYSVIGFFVILSIWGIVRILTNTFGLTNTYSAPTTTEIRNLIPR